MYEKNVIKSQIKNILEKLLTERGISIDRIVIFGSFVKGRFREDSDIDVIIVSRSFQGKSIFERVRMTTGIGRELVRKLKIPFDLLYYSDEEWENEDFLIINEAKEKGEVIYI
ncbi:MAG TPA: nucleotidyltransferase domain-containing protein [Candidatus Hydrogenedens sp.]|nr:nucleotidyltransferase domain-containing protein [Candidatus Hydrogenedens sp.]